MELNMENFPKILNISYMKKFVRFCVRWPAKPILIIKYRVSFLVTFYAIFIRKKPSV